MTELSGNSGKLPVTSDVVERARRALDGSWEGEYAVGGLVRELCTEVEKLRAAPFRCQTHKCGWCGGCKAAGIDDENENLRATIDRVRKLHICTQPIRGTIDDPYVHPCDSCGERLPCTTIRALDGETPLCLLESKEDD